VLLNTNQLPLGVRQDGQVSSNSNRKP
jgi:hypothetical protein